MNKTSNESDELLTTAEASRLLRVHPRTLLRYVESAGLPAVRLSGREFRFRRASLEAFFQRLEASVG